MPFFKTDSFAAPGLGVIAGLIMLIGGMVWLNYRTRSAFNAGEGYGQHNDKLAVVDHSAKPSLMVALLPIILVILINFICTKWLLPSMDNS